MRNESVVLAWGLLIYFLFMCASQPGNTQEIKPQVSEATHFFAQLANQTPSLSIANLAQDNLTQLKQKSAITQQITIPLLEQPDASLAVPILIEDRMMATFLVDTGSSYTVITPKLAQKLGITLTSATPRLSLMTANGAITAPLITLKNVSIGQIKVPEITAVVQPLGNGNNPLLNGLLGMNFFRGMTLTVKETQLILGIQEP
jgi:clan AA aspartic protease (TIGR02281 family)